MSTQKFFNISSYKTASRCWLPINQYIRNSNSNSIRYFSSRQRCINFNNIIDSNLVSNDDILVDQNEEIKKTSSSDFENFEPTVFSSEEIYTAGPVNKA